MQRRLSIIACNSGRYFVNEMLATLLDIMPIDKFRLIKTKQVYFANGEVKTVIEEPIRGDDVYVVQCLEDPVSEKSLNDKLMALMTAIDAARRSDAHQVTAIVLPYPYARQDKQGAREPITASFLARFLEELGVDKVITLDVHAEATAGFFRKAIFFNLHASHALMRYVKKTFLPDLQDLVVVSPDAGGTKRAKFFAKTMRAKLAIVYKERDYSTVNKIEKTTLVGDVRDKHVLIVDDMVDTGGTVESVILMLKENGAKNIYFACSHALLNGQAIERLDYLYKKGYLKAVIATNTVFRGKQFSETYPWFHSVSIAPFVAKVIKNVNSGDSAVSVIEQEYADDFK